MVWSVGAAVVEEHPATTIIPTVSSPTLNRRNLIALEATPSQ